MCLSFQLTTFPWPFENSIPTAVPIMKPWKFHYWNQEKKLINPVLNWTVREIRPGSSIRSMLLEFLGTFISVPHLEIFRVRTPNFQGSFRVASTNCVWNFIPMYSQSNAKYLKRWKFAFSLLVHLFSNNLISNFTDYLLRYLQ